MKTNFDTLKVGRKYRRRDGEIDVVTTVVQSSAARWFETATGTKHAADGLCVFAPCPYDLIEELPEAGVVTAEHIAQGVGDLLGEDKETYTWDEVHNAGRVVTTIGGAAYASPGTRQNPSHNATESVAEFKVGDKVIYTGESHTATPGYYQLAATIVAIGPKRATLEVVGAGHVAAKLSELEHANKPPRKAEGWVNVYENEDGSMRFGKAWDTKAKAIAAGYDQDSRYIGTGHIKFTEGEDNE